MLNWITSRSISVPWPNSSLRISLSKIGLTPSAIRSLRFAGAKSLSGNWSLRMIIPTAIFCSKSGSTTSLASAPTSGGCKSRRLVARSKATEAARQQTGSTPPITTPRRTTSPAVAAYSRIPTSVSGRITR